MLIYPSYLFDVFIAAYCLYFHDDCCAPGEGPFGRTVMPYNVRRPAEVTGSCEIQSSAAEPFYTLCSGSTQVLFSAVRLCSIEDNLYLYLRRSYTYR